MPKHTPQERVIAAILAEFLDEHGGADSNNPNIIKAVWSYAEEISNVTKPINFWDDWYEDEGYDNWQCGDCGTWYDYTTKHCHKKLDDYLGVRGYSSIEEAIMSVTQKAIDAVPLTYLKIGSQLKPTGYWKNVNDILVYVTNDKPQVYTLGNSSTSL